MGARENDDDFFFFFLNGFIHFSIYIEIFQCCFISSLDYWGTFCAGVSPMPFFCCCCRDLNPDSGNANMVYQHLEDVSHPDPLFGLLGFVVVLVLKRLANTSELKVMLFGYWLVYLWC